MSNNNLQNLTPEERRAVRAERLSVREAEPYGWICSSGSDDGNVYHLFVDPDTKTLSCICADFIFRGNGDSRYECKHVSAVLKFVGRLAIQSDYYLRPVERQAA